jgi:hypothetical protein
VGGRGGGKGMIRGCRRVDGTVEERVRRDESHNK